MPKKKSKAENTDWGKFMEIVIGTVMAFAVIAIVFAGLYLGFGLIKKTITPNAVEGVYSGSAGIIEWVIITIVTGLIVATIIKKMISKGIIKVTK